jgi:pyruvate ferredoxin oxidoreductase alpha subunit
MAPTRLTGNAAAAWGARLAEVDYIPAFPITPQTEIIETLGTWIDGGEMPGRMVTLESEHSMLTAAGAAAATGVRVFSATSSQGLLYAMEMLYTVAGWRAPPGNRVHRQRSRKPGRGRTGRRPLFVFSL